MEASEEGVFQLHAGALPQGVECLRAVDLAQVLEAEPRGLVLTILQGEGGGGGRGRKKGRKGGGRRKEEERKENGESMKVYKGA